jgi:hypothetical protein
MNAKESCHQRCLAEHEAEKTKVGDLLACVEECAKKHPSQIERFIRWIKGQDDE